MSYIPNGGGGAAATKEIFFPVEYYINDGDYKVDPAPSSTYLEQTFHVPDDFSSITELVLAYIPYNNGSGYFNLYSDYGGAGEDYQQHSQSQTNVNIAFTDGVLSELDISGLFSSLAAGDYCGFSIYNQGGLGWYFYVLGIRLKYS